MVPLWQLGNRCWHLVWVGALAAGLWPATYTWGGPPTAASCHVVVGRERSPDSASYVRVTAVDARTEATIPVRVVVTDSTGGHVDGSGRGLYADGRFFAEGEFVVQVPAGATRFQLEHGPHYIPLEFALDVESGWTTRVIAKLACWLAPAERGWYAGDNHVHAQHDRNALVKTDLAYTALQARAAGLSFVTEAGSNVSYDDIDKLDRDDFLLRYAGELRPGPYIGHLNTPGIESPLPEEQYRIMSERPLPAQAIRAAVQQRGGLTIHTHPLTPPHQLHWMGATEVFSDAVLGKCANLFDVDGEPTRLLWFALLNLGNRVGVSGYTDSALGRTRTLAPGDRRIYCRATRLDYRELVAAMRGARTMATNGGPVFVFLDIDGRQPGDTLSAVSGQVVAHLEVRSLHALRSAELYLNGVPVAPLDVRGQSGVVSLSPRVEVPAGRASWLVARAEDEHGKWCLTSPICLEPNSECRQPSHDRQSAVLLEICNATRFVQLRPQFYAHLIVTVPEKERLRQVALYRDGRPERELQPAAGDRFESGRVPVTGMDGEYGAGWVWYPNPAQPSHLQADWPVTESGWYHVQATTGQDRTVTSDQVYFDVTNPASHALSVANLRGPDTAFALWGYGEEAPLSSLQPPYDQAEWWYPRNAYWRVTARFGDHRVEQGRSAQQAAERFRAAPD